MNTDLSAIKIEEILSSVGIKSDPSDIPVGIFVQVVNQYINFEYHTK